MIWKGLIVREFVKKVAEKTGNLLKDVVMDEDVMNHARMGVGFGGFGGNVYIRGVKCEFLKMFNRMHMKRIVAVVIAVALAAGTLGAQVPQGQQGARQRQAVEPVQPVKKVQAAGGAEVPMVMGPNEPVGEAKGIFPGRVVWTHAPGAASWDASSGNWFEDRWNRQEDTDWMVAKAICALTGTRKEKKAWKALFVSFNQTHRGKAAGYVKGEKIAVKANMNNSYSVEDSEEINASPHMVLSLLRSLIKKGGVPQECITVFDASRYITDDIYNKCKAEFPGVVFLDHDGMNGRVKATFTADAIPYSVDNGDLARGLADCAIEADYLINLALLKGHEGQGVTLCGKNWYGTTSIHANWRLNKHNNFNHRRDGRTKYMTFVDFMAHKDLGGKTMLYLIDGLYGSPRVDKEPTTKWPLAPFGDDWACTLLASQDPVAIDAVGLDILVANFPTMRDVPYCDTYLVEAAQIGNAPSGTVYDPERDGTPVTGSLGVFEHWNNPTDRQYSRNLGRNEGIELVYIRK